MIASNGYDRFVTSLTRTFFNQAILLGDITLEQLTATSGTTILFVIFTLFGVIILLNVLIAIISDSYEKATLRGQVLFARARVMFVAQNESLERFLKPRLRHRQQHQQQEPTHPLSAEERYVAAWNRMKRIGRWLVLTAVLGTALFTEAWLVATFASLLRSYKSKHLIYCLVSKCGFLPWAYDSGIATDLLTFIIISFFSFFPWRSAGMLLVGCCNLFIG